MVEVRYNAVDMNATKKVDGSYAGGHEISGDISSLTTYENVANYITFDGLGIDLYDDNSKFYEDGDFVGVLSANVSDEYGDFSGFDMTVAINTADFLANGKSVSVEFVGNSCSYCDARLYEVENGGVKPDTPEKPYIEHKSAVFSENNQNVANFVFEEIPTTEICWVSFIPQKTKHPHSFIKIQRLLLGKVEVLSDVKDINITEEINILSEDLPMNELDCSLLSEEPPNFAEQNPLTVYSNGKFFGSFYVDDVVRETENLYSIVAFNAIKKTDEDVIDIWQSKVLNCDVLLKMIVEDFEFSADGHSIEFKGNPVLISSEETLSNYDFHGYMGGETKRKILCALAYALNLWIDNSSSDTIVLKKYPAKISHIISQNRILGDAVLNKQNVLKSIEFETGALIDSGESFSGEINSTVRGEEFEHYWGDNAPAELDGTSNINLYWDTLYGFKGMHIDEAISGLYLPTYTAHRISFSRQTSKITNENNKSKATKKINGFGVAVTNSNGEWLDKTELANKYINSRGTVKAKIRLRDEKIGDMVKIPTAWDGEIEGMITYMNIDFGYEDVADIEIMQWSE